MVGLGALIWRAPFFPQDRTLVWKLPSRVRAAPRVELTLFDETGAVLKREEHSEREGLAEELQWKLPLTRVSPFSEWTSAQARIKRAA
ncbi:MAG: hypothetical protein ACT4TC_01685 [Myxococcaceae bacterium]